MRAKGCLSKLALIHTIIYIREGTFLLLNKSERICLSLSFLSINYVANLALFPGHRVQI